ncbi:Wzz/FepE/Etk N-terminal domain-containing protein [Thalassomonas actiniarum]|uniref:LPS O-antigen length regulator n=1 Tax=Thalassomonas actiniarum TaxID=485447 RepID=A0AAF0C4Y6_9GAMM|nr:Wzz/FepE/Etk N-terminal domain-containing protein [Thalassomonas actiniarum]WDE00541.1 LPS O-antigen length regulator [Thalassomonas actiniarum]
MVSELKVSSSSEISIKEIIRLLYASRIFIVVSSIIFAVLSVALALSLPNKYKSEAVLVTAVDSQSGLSGLAGKMGGLGGLAGLAGLDLNAGQNNNVVIGKEYFQSRSFIMNFIEKHSILVPLMAGVEWDEETDEILLDDGLYDVQTKMWLIGDAPDEQTRPKTEDVLKEFKKLIRLQEDDKSGLIKVELEFYSPKLAQQWLTLFIDDVNETLRQRDEKNAQESIAFLKEKLQSTDNANLQQTLFDLIEEQTKSLMLTNRSGEYVFQYIDLPSLAEKKSAPQRALICVAGTVVGCFLSMMFVLIRYFARVE